MGDKEGNEKLNTIEPKNELLKAGTQCVFYRDLDRDCFLTRELCPFTIMDEDRKEDVARAGCPFKKYSEMRFKLYEGILHRGLHHYRTQQELGFGERAFADEWEKQNERSPGINQGYGTLELLLCASDLFRPGEGTVEPLDTITERDARVVATVIQWFGTSVGQGFLHAAQARVARYREEFEANGGLNGVMKREFGHE